MFGPKALRGAVFCAAPHRFTQGAARLLVTRGDQVEPRCPSQSHSEPSPESDKAIERVYSRTLISEKLIERQWKAEHIACSSMHHCLCWQGTVGKPCRCPCPPNQHSHHQWQCSAHMIRLFLFLIDWWLRTRHNTRFLGLDMKNRASRCWMTPQVPERTDHQLTRLMQISCRTL